MPTARRLNIVIVMFIVIVVVVVIVIIIVLVIVIVDLVYKGFDLFVLPQRGPGRLCSVLKGRKREVVPWAHRSAPPPQESRMHPTRYVCNHHEGV